MKVTKSNKLIIILVAFVFSSMTAFAGKVDHKANYEKKVKVNDETIGVIAGVINYVCPKLVDSSTNICDTKDPVTSAVKFQEQLLGGKGKTIDDLDDLEVVERDLEQAGITKPQIHVLSEDDAGVFL